MSSRSSRCASTSLRCLSIDSELPLSCEAGQLQWQSVSRRACARILLTRSTLSMTKARPPIGSMAFRSVVRRRSKVGVLDAVAVPVALALLVRDITKFVVGRCNRQCRTALQGRPWRQLDEETKTMAKTAFDHRWDLTTQRVAIRSPPAKEDLNGVASLSNAAKTKGAGLIHPRVEACLDWLADGLDGIAADCVRMS
jgi:hypothetical protein